MHGATTTKKISAANPARPIVRSTKFSPQPIHPGRIAWLSAVILGLLPLAVTSAAECAIDSSTIDRGERKQFYICSRDITTDYKLGGLAEAGITVSYDQFIRRCAVGDNRRGIFFWLEAGTDATSATISVTDANTGQPLCEPLSLTVPKTPVRTSTCCRSRPRRDRI
jgi:hypothetical protein